MSTSIEAITTPVLPVPLKDEINPASAAVIQVDGHPVNTETTQAQEHITITRVTLVQHLSSVFNKAKQSMTDAVSDAQKAINERNTHKKSTDVANATTTDSANSTNIDTSTPVTTSSNGNVTKSETTGKNPGGGPNNAIKGILNRVKGLKTAHVSVAEPTSVTEETTRNEGAPIPPPKDHAKPIETTTPTTNPVLDQFKRNTALLTKFLLQKKKDFTERKSSDANQQETGTPELHSETGTNKPTSNGSPLARRITQLVNNATASKNKKKDTETDYTVVVTEPTIINESPAVVTGTA
ncbi:hypothetical protein BD770DRAFT_443104 [Pilaira anomala]|nr:hypothetical protein BD770DRAFT_443104 [Pilaira anomala]